MQSFKQYITEAEYQGRTVTLNKPFRSNDGKKKFDSQSSGHFKEAKEIGYRVGKELLKKAGTNFKIKGS